jgi:hypothetical protein
MVIRRKRKVVPTEDPHPVHKFNECLKCVLDGDSHYVRLNNKVTYCGESVSIDLLSNSIGIVTCNKCVNIFINRGPY